MNKPQQIGIVGTVGIPASYGGFETLAEQLVRCYESDSELDCVVYCSSVDLVDSERSEFFGARLRYLRLPANGSASVAYDLLSMGHFLLRGGRTILLLGVSGAIAIPVFKFCFRARIITNIDGIEWKRAKWGRFASWFLRLSERIAVRHSDVVIADNAAIVAHVERSYGRGCALIAYGGDHIPEPQSSDLIDAMALLGRGPYALGLCRIEPENNVELILRAFAENAQCRLVFIGNWSASAYGRRLKADFSSKPNLTLMDAIYDQGLLSAIRKKALFYVHGHSAGGTNPSLVEMMYLGVPVLAFDCPYNRCSTEDSARYFSTPQELQSLIGDDQLISGELKKLGAQMREIANRRYLWSQIAAAYKSALIGRS